VVRARNLAYTIASQDPALGDDQPTEAKMLMAPPSNNLDHGKLQDSPAHPMQHPRYGPRTNHNDTCFAGNTPLTRLSFVYVGFYYQSIGQKAPALSSEDTSYMNELI